MGERLSRRRPIVFDLLHDSVRHQVMWESNRAFAGGQAQASLYFTGPLGAAVSVNVDWVGGSSLILPGGVAAMIVAGPVLRWGLK